MRRFLLVLSLFGAAQATRAFAQGPAQAPVLREPTDWGPDAAWRRRARAVRTLRMELLRSGNISTLNAVRGGTFFTPSLVLPGAATAVTGAFHIPVIAISYRDLTFPLPTEDYKRILLSSSPSERHN